MDPTGETGGNLRLGLGESRAGGVDRNGGTCPVDQGLQASAQGGQGRSIQQRSWHQERLLLGTGPGQSALAERRRLS